MTDVGSSSGPQFSNAADFAPAPRHFVTGVSGYQLSAQSQTSSRSDRVKPRYLFLYKQALLICREGSDADAAHVIIAKIALEDLSVQDSGADTILLDVSGLGQLEFQLNSRNAKRTFMDKLSHRILAANAYSSSEEEPAAEPLDEASQEEQIMQDIDARLSQVQQAVENAQRNYTASDASAFSSASRVSGAMVPELLKRELADTFLASDALLAATNADQAMAALRAAASDKERQASSLTQQVGYSERQVALKDVDVIRLENQVARLQSEFDHFERAWTHRDQQAQGFIREAKGMIQELIKSKLRAIKSRRKARKSRAAADEAELSAASEESEGGSAIIDNYKRLVELKSTMVRDLENDLVTTERELAQEVKRNDQLVRELLAAKQQLANTSVSPESELQQVRGALTAKLDGDGRLLATLCAFFEGNPESPSVRVSEVQQLRARMQQAQQKTGAKPAKAGNLQELRLIFRQLTGEELLVAARPARNTQPVPTAQAKAAIASLERARSAVDDMGDRSDPKMDVELRNAETRVMHLHSQMLRELESEPRVELLRNTFQSLQQSHSTGRRDHVTEIVRERDELKAKLEQARQAEPMVVTRDDTERIQKLESELQEAKRLAAESRERARKERERSAEAAQTAIEAERLALVVKRMAGGAHRARELVEAADNDGSSEVVAILKSVENEAGGDSVAPENAEATALRQQLEDAKEREMQLQASLAAQERKAQGTAERQGRVGKHLQEIQAAHKELDQLAHEERPVKVTQLQLEGEIDYYGLELAERQAEIKALQAQSEHGEYTTSHLKLLDHRVSEIKEATEQRQERMAAIRQQASTFEHARDALMQRISSSEQQLMETARDEVGADTNLFKLILHYQNVARVDAGRARVLGDEADIASAQLRVSELAAEDAKRELTEMKDLGAKLGATISQLTARLQTNARQLATLTATVGTMDDTLNKAIQKSDAQEEVTNKLRAELEASKAQGLGEKKTLELMHEKLQAQQKKTKEALKELESIKAARMQERTAAQQQLLKTSQNKEAQLKEARDKAEKLEKELKAALAAAANGSGKDDQLEKQQSVAKETRVKSDNLQAAPVAHSDSDKVSQLEKKLLDARSKADENAELALNRKLELKAARAKVEQQAKTAKVLKAGQKKMQLKIEKLEADLNVSQRKLNKARAQLENKGAVGGAAAGAAVVATAGNHGDQKKLEKDLKEARAKVEEQGKAAKLHKAELKESRAKAEQLEAAASDNKKLEKDLKEARDKANKLEVELKAATAAAAGSGKDSEEKTQKLEKDLKEARAKVEEQGKAAKKLKSDLKEARAKVEEQGKAAKKLKSDLKQARDKADKLEKELKAAGAAAATATVAAAAASGKKGGNKKLEKELKEARDKVVELEAAAAAHEKEKESLQKQLETARSEAAAERLEKVNAETQLASSSDVAQLRADLEDARKQVDALVGSQAAVMAEKHKLAQELVSLKESSAEQLSTKLDELRAELAAKERRMEASLSGGARGEQLQKEVDQLKAERVAMVQKLQAALKDSQAKGKTIAQLLKHSNMQAVELREERSRSASLRSSAQSSPKAERKAPGGAELNAKLMTQLRELGMKLGQEQKKSREAEELAQQKVAQTVQLMSELNDVTENLSSAQRKVQLLEERLAEKRESENVPQQVQHLEDEVAGLKEQVAYLKSTIYDNAQREEEVQGKLAEVDTLRAELQKKTELVGKLQTTAGLLTQKINELNRAGAAGGAAEQLLKERIKELEVTNEGLESEVAMLKSAIKH